MRPYCETRIPKAEDAYTSSHTDVLELLESLTELVQDMDAPGTTPINWAHVGSMNEIKRKLLSVMEFMGGGDS